MTKEEAYRYIDSLKWLKGYDNTTIDGKTVGEILDEIKTLLKEQPDIVECKDCLYYDMVECKDCMYYDNDILECKNDDIAMLIHHCGCYPAFTPYPTWFCAYGQRKRSEDD